MTVISLVVSTVVLNNCEGSAETKKKNVPSRLNQKRVSGTGLPIRAMAEIELEAGVGLV